MKSLQFIGILLGALYGLVYRLICGGDFSNDIYSGFNIYTITFVWILPIIIGVIPIIVAQKEILKSRSKQFFFPFLSVSLFFLISLLTRIEDWLCILIFAFPFMFGAGLTGLLISPLIKRYHSNKMYSIVLLPFLLSPVESFFPNTQETFEVISSTKINASDDEIWNYLIEVPEIKNDEYNPGFFNFIGIPRPVKSELVVRDGVEYRIGHFSDDLKLYETIEEIKENEFVSFKIHLNKSELRDLPTDKHLLQSNYFKFESIAYQLRQNEDGTTELKLKCHYSINSKMNNYANFWAEKIIKDFETRLLASLKLKIEST